VLYYHIKVIRPNGSVSNGRWSVSNGFVRPPDPLNGELNESSSVTITLEFILYPLRLFVSQSSRNFASLRLCD